MSGIGGRVPQKGKRARLPADLSVCKHGRATLGKAIGSGRGERIRADTPSPSSLIPVANIPSYVGRVWKTA